MEHATHQSPESAPCTIHSFEAVSIHGGGSFIVSVWRDHGRSQATSFNVEADCCLLCGVIQLRVSHPGALRFVVEAREEHGHRKA